MEYYVATKNPVLSERSRCKVAYIFMIPYSSLIIYFLKGFMYLFLERGEGREKEKEGNIDVWLLLTCPQQGTQPTTQACALTGNRTSNPLLCSLVLSPLSHTSLGRSHIVYMCPSLCAYCMPIKKMVYTARYKCWEARLQNFGGFVFFYLLCPRVYV